MKFEINDKEIKTVLSGAVIEGSLNLVARSASFEYLYNPDDGNFSVYKAKIGNSVKIKNDDGDCIFKGRVTEIGYQTDKNTIQIQAQDLLSILLSTKIAGRFKGTLTSILNKTLAGFDFTFGLDSILQKEINILSLGSLNLFDIIKIAISKTIGDDFAIYINGNSKLRVLIPLIGNCAGEFNLGENILSSNFTSSISENSAKIQAIGDDDIVSGTIIKVNDSSAGLSGYFTVIKDRHIYTGVHTMELELEERSFA